MSPGVPSPQRKPGDLAEQWHTDALLATSHVRSDIAVDIDVREC